jgi:hypothetical protein
MAEPAGLQDDAADMLDDPGEETSTAAGSTRQRRRQPKRAANFGQRAHHVTTDYGYVHRDLIMMSAIGALVLAFIVVMSFVLN